MSFDLWRYILWRCSILNCHNDIHNYSSRDPKCRYSYAINTSIVVLFIDGPES